MLSCITTGFVVAAIEEEGSASYAILLRTVGFDEKAIDDEALGSYTVSFSTDGSALEAITLAMSVIVRLCSTTSGFSDCAIALDGLGSAAVDPSIVTGSVDDVTEDAAPGSYDMSPVCIAGFVDFATAWDIAVRVRFPSTTVGLDVDDIVLAADGSYVVLLSTCGLLDLAIADAGSVDMTRSDISMYGFVVDAIDDA